MRRKHLFIILSMILVNNCTNIKKDSDPMLNGCSYTFRVTEISNPPQITFPNDSIKEEQYQTISNGKEYHVRLSLQKDTVFINYDSIVGEKISENERLTIYNLSKGVFAGGKFVIWNNIKPQEAELTIYGSGIPIIKSEKGILTENQ